VVGDRDNDSHNDTFSATSSHSQLVIDGVSIDPVTLVCLDGNGAPLAVSRMGVRELRAELAARKAPVSGNKKELAKRLQVGKGPDFVECGVCTRWKISVPCNGASCCWYEWGSVEERLRVGSAREVCWGIQDD